MGFKHNHELYQQLKDQLNTHSYNYYVLDDPQISDFEYDQMYRQLEQLEKQYPELITTDSPTQRVADKPLQQFDQIEHTIPMLSLGNVFTHDELLNFNQRLI